MLLQAAHSSLLVVDIQQRLAPAIAGQETLINRAATLIEAAHRLHVPILVSEQYPQGLGHTVGALVPLLQEADQIVSKTHFSCLREPAYADSLRQLGRRQMVVAGMEAHVCVLQTVMDLLQQRFEVYVVADAIGSRVPESRSLAIERMRTAGAAVVTVEMVLFEWLERADRPEFRPVSALIR
jgi:Amidases related to nicotinamidase